MHQDPQHCACYQEKSSYYHIVLYTYMVSCFLKWLEKSPTRSKLTMSPGEDSSSGIASSQILAYAFLPSKLNNFYQIGVY